MNIALSIIIPVYNAEKYLDFCIKSLLDQDLVNFEIILVDDGSRDGSLDIIKRYVQLDSRINYLVQENSGPGKARNNGIRIAKGEYITFVDADDWVTRNIFLNIIHEAKKHSIDVLITPLHYEYDTPEKSFVKALPIIENVPLNKEYIRDNILPDFLYRGSFGTPCKFYKTDFLRQNGILFPEGFSLGEDWQFNMEVFSHASSVLYISNVHYHYRQINSGSLMRKYRPELAEIYLNKSPLEKYFVKWGLYNDATKLELAKRKCYIALVGCIVNEFKPDNSNSTLQKIKRINQMIRHPEVMKAVDVLMFSEKNVAKRIYLLLLKKKFSLGIALIGKLYSFNYKKR